jgi:hypothetical protein
VRIGPRGRLWTSRRRRHDKPSSSVVVCAVLGARPDLAARAPAARRTGANGGGLLGRQVEQSGQERLTRVGPGWFETVETSPVIAHAPDRRQTVRRALLGRKAANAFRMPKPVNLVSIPRMSPDRIVLNHLLEGRQALVAEVERLTAAIRDLDAVIDRVSDTGTGGSRLSGDFEPVTTRSIRAARSRSAHKPSGRRSVTRRSAPAGGDGQKSIRILVLEMLESEDRDFGLAEIIDRIHAAGVDAHDDAVRSITIKLMKDGRVERVGRGQYRLAGWVEGERSDHSPTDAADSDEAAAPITNEDGGPTPLNLAQSWDAPGN